MREKPPSAVFPGELRMATVRAVLGPEIAKLAAIHVAVLGTAGEPPAVGIVTLMTMREGNGHRVFRCPHCGRPCRRLVPRSGRLRCLRCHGYRSRAHHERGCLEWRLGNEVEDRIIRLVTRCTPTAATLAKAAALTVELLDTDRRRVERLLERIAIV